eukprot:6648437-Karenia_brevis.AAC.1
MQRATTKARQFFHSHGRKSVFTTFLSNVHKVGGTLGTHSDSPMPTLQLLPVCIVWRDTEWWNCYRVACAHARAEKWRHSRSGNHLRWDRAFVHALGADWKQLARSPDTWKKLK